MNNIFRRQLLILITMICFLFVHFISCEKKFMLKKFCLILSSAFSIFTPCACMRSKGEVTGLGVRIIGERAKRARHSQVCSIENRGYIYI